MSVVDSVTKQYELNQDIIRKCEGEIQDLLHEIEIGNSKNAYEGYLLYKELREIRIARRNAKDENEQLNELYNYLKSHLNLKQSLQYIQSKCQKKANMQENRTYKPRVRKDLTISEEKPENNKKFKKLLKDFNKEQRKRKKHAYL